MHGPLARRTYTEGRESMKGKIRRCAVWDAYLTDAEVVAAVTELTAEAPAQAQGRSIGGQPLWAYYDADDFGTTYSDGVGGSMGA